MTFRLRSILTATLVFLAATCAAPGQGVYDRVPGDLEGVAVDEQLGATIPMDLAFTDENGATVRLADFFDGERPVLLTPVFYNCPQLCTLVLNGLAAGMNGIDETAGVDFQIVTYSFDPDETHELASVKKRAYLTQYRREPAKDGWHFLVGSQQSISALDDALGVTHNRLDDGTYAHAPVVAFVTPDGRIARYMNDVMFKPRDLRLALTEASEGTIGSPLDHIALFFCFQYDPDKNSYTWAAFKLVRLVGLMTVLLIAVGVICLSLMGPRRHLRKATAAASNSEEPVDMANGET